jgi:hypothetical protein
VPGKHTSDRVKLSRSASCERIPGGRRQQRGHCNVGYCVASRMKLEVSASVPSASELKYRSVLIIELVDQ